MLNRLHYWYARLRGAMRWRVVAPVVIAYSEAKGEEYSSTSALLVDYWLLKEDERLDVRKEHAN